MTLFLAWIELDVILLMDAIPVDFALYFLISQGEDVLLVGDFSGNWKEPIKATHKGGSRYETEVRLSPGK